MKHSDYEEHYVAGHRPKKIPLDSKYGVCFRIFLSFLPMMMKKSLDADELKISVVMEAGAQGQGDTSRIFNLFKKQAAPEQSQLIDSVTSADKRKFYGLQYADFMAYTAFRAEQDNPDLTDYPAESTLADCRALVDQVPSRSWLKFFLARISGTLRVAD
jgi:Protein of unknown function (DUF3800)